MTIKTSRGKTYDVDWIDPSIIGDKNLMLQMTDTRRLPIIAAEFDELELIQRFDEQQGDKQFEGYAELVMIQRFTDGSIQISLGKPKEVRM